ncbi:hypothetical protein GA0111570_10938 [Raineyella antarctica]|uniref:Mannosylglycerate hydrolase MGH1-like glycoside hydrolase domain-containing protein n=1 Tax=Raineyella antarctica TaxID=1577474 RepID=A0A1G6HGI0_9ACTN|nr:hypothetical protein GA0111570_10938 [Raineyella antarctica]
MAATQEGRRLAQSASDDSAWRRWGPYVAARQWGTVREDYSANGDAWRYFPFDQAHQRAYRWGEDGLGGLCDRYGFLNLAVALWNTHDDRLKERLFGLTGPEGNHGEDVKEYYWALDATPTHSWAQWLYRYPQAAFPYQQLREANAHRGYHLDEYELADTGILAEDRFFDVTVTHAKAGATDICVVYEATNHGPDAAPLHLVPQLWFRNTWVWGEDRRMATMQQEQFEDERGYVAISAEQAWLNRYTLFAEGAPEVLWCANETDDVACFGAEENHHPYPKDAVDRAIVHGDRTLLSPEPNGTKVALDYAYDAVPPGATVRVRLRLVAGDGPKHPFDDGFDRVLADRRAEADEFYGAVIPASADANDTLVARRAFAGLNWGKQLYRYSVREWLSGDPAMPPPPDQRRAPEPAGRNTSWGSFDLADVISMPDDWEYPWFASWDLAFHTVALADIDPAFAKSQLLLMCREWSQHPDGQLPAYEWSFSDVNPPVHAWAAWQVYLADGGTDRVFLTRIMTKLLLNFGWWVNRKDEAGNELFEGGFLGMDNISVFDRSRSVPQGWRLEQSDATSWVAFMCLSMLRIAQELARADPAWGDIATTYLERFLAISQAVENFGTNKTSLWDEQDGFFYDILVDGNGAVQPVRVRSLVGFVPLLAVANSPAWVGREIPQLARHRAWLKRHRPDLARYILADAQSEDAGVTLSLVDRDRYPRLLERLFDPREFLADHGIRSLPADYRDGVELDLLGQKMGIRYTPGYSEDGMFGGNSNWRGPIWFPLNVLLIDALRTRAEGVGGPFEVEFPTGSGEKVTLDEAANRIEQRLLDLFRPAPDGRRPGEQRDHPGGPLWDAHPTFSEYFHGDDGTGLGASHQTGWTGMVAHLICTPPPAGSPAGSPAASPAGSPADPPATPPPASPADPTPSHP